MPMTALNFTTSLIAAAMALLPSTDGRHREIIEGRYCGTAWSGGRLVEVVTTLTTEADGMLAGVYEFADNGQDTPGTLREYVREEDVDFRRLVWIDKYGTGWLTIRFDKSRNSFNGNWGVEFDPPTYRWDGQRCDGIARS
jgi:hypothetical protein